MTGLKFYPASHRYKLDGEWVQGVTTILKQAIPAPALMKWSARTVAEYVADNPDGVDSLRQMGRSPMVAALKQVPWQQRDEAGNKGTAVHDFAERIAKGEGVDVPEYLTGHVQSCLDFFEDWNIDPLLVEETVGSREHQYAGKFDLIANSSRAPLAIYDYKTSKSGIYPETAYQLAAYAGAEFYGEGGNEHPLPDVEESYGVHIRTDGYTVYPLAFGPRIYDEFTHLLESSRIIKRALGDWRIPGTGYVGLPVDHDQEGAA